MKLSVREIITQIWDAQGYGNLAVWDDGSTRVIEPGTIAEKNGMPALAIFKPLPLVGGFPMLDHAIYDKNLQETVAETIRRAGGEVTGE